MNGKTIINLPEAEQAGMLKELRRGRSGYLLALHVLVLCARGYSPSLIAELLLCSRTSIYRIVKAYQSGKLGLEFDPEGISACPVQTTVLLPHVKRSLVALLKKSPKVFGWCRTRWSAATLALELEARRGIEVSAETMRRWLHEIGWVWKRAKLVAHDDDPARITKLATIGSWPNLLMAGWQGGRLRAHSQDERNHRASQGNLYANCHPARSLPFGD